MHRSTEQILTTHVGSLIRPDVIRQHLRAKQKGEGYDPAAHARDLKATVAEVVRQQAEVGVDVISDGEMRRLNFQDSFGAAVEGYDEEPVARHLKGLEVDISVDLGLGDGRATVWTCDLTHGYISINADYRS